MNQKDLIKLIDERIELKLQEVAPAGTEVASAMKIGGKEVSEITVITSNGELVCSISGQDIIEKDGFKVTLT